MNKIAVILPVYMNDKVEFLSLSVDSILNQTYRDIHIFIGVDGPINDDLEKYLNIINRKDHVSIIRFSENRGLACVLNDLLDICFKEGYEYIARMDADDISVRNRFEKQMAFLEVHKDIDVVGGSVLVIDKNGKSKGQVLKYPETHNACVERFSRRNPLSHPAVLFRKSYFEKAGCKYRPDYKKNQDTLLWYDGLLKGVKMGNVQDVILKFRSTDDMIKKRRSGIDAAKKQLSARLMINKGLGYGFISYFYAYAIFILMISPSWLRSFVYSKQ
ncbi:glycosyltransferase [Prevotella sp. E15-22]|uniref:glycosyltransferase n=1 Tax=Prevotella sp. E15-22 TaxID=2937774 RepID=UPI00206F3B48|nr:glycosyltransferase [Prevotella sp. E15-22]UPS45267.1 glycosyltransferase [Prevotella sp. E15-22]